MLNKLISIYWNFLLVNDFSINKFLTVKFSINSLISWLFNFHTCPTVYTRIPRVHKQWLQKKKNEAFFSVNLWHSNFMNGKVLRLSTKGIGYKFHTSHTHTHTKIFTQACTTTNMTWRWICLSTCGVFVNELSYEILIKSKMLSFRLRE